MTTNDHDTTGLAIIGMSGRFPGARSVAEFWQNLREGRESVTVLDEATLRASGVDDSALADPTYVRASPILDDIELFDAPLFDISPGEARLLDPQHRLFLECAWEALEDGGYLGARRDLSIGVYGSATMSSYLLNNLQHLPALRRARNGLNMSTLQVLVANDKDYVATRVAFKLDLRGPSYTVQSACSSSLVAFHVACQALLAGECDLALAGGASIKVPQHLGYYHEPGSIVSPDGHCRAFDAKGEGTVFGSGVGVVLVRRLEDALASGDRIWAVVRGSASNNDGALKMGFAAPSVEAQAQVVEEALQVAGVSPDTIGYVEAHGTGTNLGDPVEIAGLTRAFRAGTRRKRFCAIGSVKTNVGHLEGASGIAGLIKAALALHHEEIPASLHFERPNPQLDLDESPFVVNTALRPWPRTAAAPRRAGVTSLGVGGTNVHVVLEEAPREAAGGRPSARPWQLLTLSAHSPAALDGATARLGELLASRPDVDLGDVAYTLNVGRAPLRRRRFAVCRDVSDARAVLSGAEPARLMTSVHERSDLPVVFMFSGQGGQYPGMGRELMETEATFRRVLDECAEILRPELGLDIRTLIYPAPGGEEAAAAALRQTANTQPALFAIELALARTWMARGVSPTALVGHSIGELVAACLASVFTVEDALRLVALRGRLIQQLPPGAMLSVAAPPAAITPLLRPGVSIAAINEPGRSVISGPTEAVEACARACAEASIDCRALHTSHAFHSAMMEPVMDRFAKAVATVPRQAPAVRCLSNVSGSWMTAEEAQDPGYWARQLRAPVRFEDEMACLLADGPALLLEVGPGRALSRFAKAHPACGSEHVVVSSMRHASEPGSDVAVFLGALGQLWAHGVAVDWSAHWSGEERRRERLPTYAFDRQRHWIDPAPAAAEGASNGANGTAHEARAEEAADAPTLPAATRPSVSTTYVAPRTPTETMFVEIWRELLGIEDVGVYDNFFELGGDSVMGVQVASKANARGLRLSPKHLFDHQCIAELAGAVDAGLGSEAVVEEDPRGPQPLLPNQAWLIERMPEFRTWVSVTVLESRERVDLPALEAALRAVRERHSALRTRFLELPDGWAQEVIEDPTPQSVAEIDLAGAPAEEFHARVDAFARELCARVDLGKGEVMCAAVARGDLHAGKRDRVIVAMHHLVQDQWGERIFMHDLELAYGQRKAGQAVELPATTTSMAALAARLRTLAERIAPDAPGGEWLRPARTAARRLPWLAAPAPDRALDRVGAFQTVLDEATTAQLLHELQRGRRVTLEEVAVSAAMSALASWSGERVLLCDMLMSARQVDLDGVDLTRSIGWFSTVHPLCVEIDARATPLERLEAAVRAMRAVRHREHEHGVLRHLAPDAALRARLAAAPTADVFFAYFGNIDDPEAGYARGLDGAMFRVDDAATDMKRTMMGAFRYALEVPVYLRAGRLHIGWLHNERMLSRETAEVVAESCMRSLRALAEAGARTPALDDAAALASATVASGQLDEILAELEQS